MNHFNSQNTNSPRPPANNGAAFTRRDFLRTASASSLALMASRLSVMAGPFEAADFEKLIPADKKLSQSWIKSLFERGVPTVYRGADLKTIGMPVGGICTGQLYLGGDGKLWHWDIFNENQRTGDGNYRKPVQPSSPIEQGFSVQVGDRVLPLDSTGFNDIAFRGEYPIGTVQYRQPGLPLEITLEAFSPFIPLNTDDSSLPATVMQFTVRNTSSEAVEAILRGKLENAVCLTHRNSPGTRLNRVVTANGFSFLECTAEETKQPTKPARPDLVFEDWNKDTYDGWTVEGEAFGSGPIQKSKIPAYQGDVGGNTERVVNSHASAVGGPSDDRTGKLTSRPFTIEHGFITFWIGGGKYPGATCLNLLVNGKVVRSATGHNLNQMAQESFDVREFDGKQGVIEIVDAQKGSWGNIGVGKIVFSDRNAEQLAFDRLPDFGSMGLALLGAPAEISSQDSSSALSARLSGELGRKLKIEPGKAASVTFVVTWFFPNLRHIPAIESQGRYYASRFDSAQAVARYVAENFERLSSQTRLWHDTCYDSTLPYWFIDRTFLNTSILATSTSYRFKDGRFWGWEGVGCCEGTCGHVWYYAQAMGRLFPELERILRERTDFGIAQKPDGAIRFRGENNGGPAIDAQAGAILRALREHQMSLNDAFLKRIWPGVKKATEWLIAQDGNGDGILEGAQHNTLDTDWFGAVAWLSGVYLAALQAAAAMADEINDGAFAKQCREILARGQSKMTAELFDGEYFYNKIDPRHPESVNSGTGCEIDQVMGQSWAFQVGLPRVLPEKETRSALKSLWRYNFSPDVGPYRDVNKPGRWYAMAGEAGLLMCSFPRANWNYLQAKGQGKGAWAAMYFNECMNGFEHQVAGHMIWEGLVQEGLAVERAVHDRYHASKRNPWNEIECGDHYARSMASYGVFLAACGYEYHGPKGHLGFAPRVTPENFKAPFTVAEGWGTFSQTADGGKRQAAVHLRFGKLRLRSLALAASSAPSAVRVTVNGNAIPARHAFQAGRVLVTLASDSQLSAGDKLEIALS